MLPRTAPLIKSQKSTEPENIPDLAALRAIWRTLATEEREFPGRRFGIAKRRQELLAAFPAWMIPDVIDALNRP